MLTRLRRSVAGLLACGAVLLGAASAHAEGLDESEVARLGRGETVTREQTLTRGNSRYVGGVTYTVVEATPQEIAGLLEDPLAYQRVLPRTRQVRLVGQNGGASFFEVHQGNAFIDAAYTLRIQKGEREARFWLDASRPHAIADAWGFFRYEPLPDDGGPTRVLLTYGVLVDLGPGIVRDLFEERVRIAMLRVPQLVRGYIARSVRARAGL